MRHNHTARRVALALLLGSSAIPAAAQDAQTVTPPSVTPAPAPAEVTPAPAPAPAPSPAITFAPSSPVVQTTPPPPAPPPEAAAPAEPAARPAATRSRTTSTARQTVRTASAPAAQAAPAPAPATAAPVATPAPAPAPAAAAPAAPESAAPAPAPSPAAQPADAGGNDTLLWAPIVIGGLIILGLIAYIFARRRRTDETVYEEEAYYEPVEEAPAAAAPAAFVAEPALPAAAAVSEGERPWIDIGLRPVRAEEGGAIEVELTVSNSGNAEAHDVRVSTWMLDGATSSDAEQALIDARSGAQVATVDVAPGDDKSVDTTVALPAEASTPILVAEARYPLPQGGEGRIAATFEIDVKDRDVEARLHDVLERA